MTKEIILSQTQMDAIINASKQNSLETITFQQLKIGCMYELMFEKRENGYYYYVEGQGHYLDSKIDNKTYEQVMDIINNPVM